MAKITYGISNVYYAVKTVNAESGAVTYGTPKPLKGAYELSLPPVGETVKVYGDNITYAKILTNQGYDGNLGLYQLSEDFETDVLGMVKNADGVMVESGNAVATEFALLGEFNTDTAQTKRFVLWNCSAGRPDFASSTKEDSITVNQLSVPITATPLEGTEIIRGSIVGDSTVAKWAAWFSAVYMPTTE